MEVEGIRKWKFPTAKSATVIAKHGWKTTHALVEDAASSMSEAIIRRVATVTATLLPDANPSTVPTEATEKEAVDHNSTGEESDGNNEGFKLLKPGRTMVPWLLQDDIREELKMKALKFERFTEHTGVEHAVIGTDKVDVAVKRSFTEQEWKREVRALERLNNLQDPSITKALATFAKDGKHYIVFEWAEHGSLRDFWHKNPDPAQLAGDVEAWLIEQCLGVAQALQLIHGYTPTQHPIAAAPFMRHGDIKPENILVFTSRATAEIDTETHGPAVSKVSLGKLKLADFGISKFHKSPTEEKVGSSIAFSPTYRPPEMDIAKASIGRSADVWSLGCVFLEFATWYVQGTSGLEVFGESRIRKNESVPSRRGEVMEDTFFSFEKGRTGAKVMLNPAISKTISNLREEPRSTKTIRSFLDLIEKMLQVSKDKRMTTDIVAETLQKISRDFSSNITTSHLPTDEEGSNFENKEQLQFRFYDADNPPSAFDRWRVRLEDRLGLGTIDWYPLPPVDRLQNATQSELIWRYGNRDLSIILNQDETERCLDIMSLVATKNNTLSAKDSPGGQTQAQNNPPNNSTGPPSFQTSIANSSKFQTSKHFKKGKTLKKRRPQNSGTAPRPGNSNPNIDNESYFCVDKATFAKQGTYLSTPVSAKEVLDDASFFKLLKKRLKIASGDLLFGFAPWMAYNAVNLCQFSFMNDNSDLVAAFDIEEFPRDELAICAGYVFDIGSNSTTERLPLDIAMRKLGKTILAGLKRPDDGWGRRNVLSALPKREVPPKLPRTYETTGWGFHVRYGVSFLSVSFWIIGLILLGLAFVPFWLALVDRKDLQNAFTPAGTLFSIAAMLLAWAALVQK
ncbi:kinase-like domain-containing protein [Nemania sp. NC0429]|nr:kinase-like domain-containing protein [Nemania sp. NC0429]